ncbi:MAG TPA: sugar phosphate isomerase/epimerase family protein [Gemmataceae bacterium]|nr:sugar phosphate isomerase/epimerase family protein [Gemmataceae bacterium]
MRHSLFSISYGGLWGQESLDLPAFIARAARLGYRAVMLAGKRPHLSPLDYAADRVAELKALLDRHGVTCPVVAAYTDFAGMPAAEVPATEIQVAYVESLCRIGRGLGSSVVRVFTAYESESQPLGAVWARVVTALREVADRAATHGFTVAIQNHHDLAVHSDALVELLQDIQRPNVRLGFDAWSPALRGEDLYETARRMAPHTAITTNADYVRLPRFRYWPDFVNYERVQPDLVRAVPFGGGFIDYRAFFTGLRDGGFDGLATYEMCSPLRGGGSAENLDRCAAQYLRWMAENGF